jgi:hypothetical protein
MTEIALRPGQEPEPGPGSWPLQQGILFCENTGCLIRGRRRPAAVTFLSIVSGAMVLSCDECARRQYNDRPDAYYVLPLSEYRDWYAEARSQMQDGVIAVTAEVIDNGSAWAAAPSPAPAVPQAAAIGAGSPAPAPAGGGPPGSSQASGASTRAAPAARSTQRLFQRVAPEQEGAAGRWRARTGRGSPAGSPSSPATPGTEAAARSWPAPRRTPAGRPGTPRPAGWPGTSDGKQAQAGARS